jgi:hypothetical protein
MLEPWFPFERGDETYDSCMIFGIVKWAPVLEFFFFVNAK